MKNCRFNLLRVVLAAFITLLAGSLQVRSAEPLTLSLFVGQAHVLSERQIRRAVIGNGKVIQATVLDDRQVLVIPESAGQSTLHLWDSDGAERLYVVTVHASSAERQVAEVRGLLGDASGLSVRAVGDKVVIEGGNLSEELMVRVGEIAKRYNTDQTTAYIAEGLGENIDFCPSDNS